MSYETYRPEQDPYTQQYASPAAGPAYYPTAPDAPGYTYPDQQSPFPEQPVAHAQPGPPTRHPYQEPPSPGGNYAPAYRPPPRRRAAWPWVLGVVLAIVLPVVLVVACGLGGFLAVLGDTGATPSPSPDRSASPASPTPASPTPAARETVRPTGGVYSFQVPTGYVSVIAPIDLRGSEQTTAAALTPADFEDILVVNPVGTFTNAGSLTAAELQKEADATVKQLGQDAATREDGTVGTYPAFRYTFKIGTLQAYNYFVFKGDVALQVVCRWTTLKQTEIQRGCDELLDTLTIN